MKVDATQLAKDLLYQLNEVSRAKVGYGLPINDPVVNVKMVKEVKKAFAEVVTLSLEMFAKEVLKGLRELK